MRQIAFGDHQRFSAVAGIHQTGRDGYANSQADVIKQNPIMGQVIDKFFALYNRQPEEFTATLANRERLIDQAVAFAEEVKRGD
jgi:hypothetical protein